MKLAIDVVLLPPQDVMAKAIQANAEITEQNSKIALNQHDCLPHISLCMGLIEEVDLPRVQDTLEDISKKFSAQELTIDEMLVGSLPDGNKVSSWRIKNNNQLTDLHLEVMRKLWPYLTYKNIDEKMFYNPQEVEKVTFGWVEGYAEEYEKPDLFRPHITLGIGEIKKYDDFPPVNFSAATIAICQMGNYCTARKVYGKFALQSQTD